MAFNAGILQTLAIDFKVVWILLFYNFKNDYRDGADNADLIRT